MQKSKQFIQNDVIRLDVPKKYRQILEETIQWLIECEQDIYNTHYLQLKQLTNCNNEKFIRGTLLPICELDGKFLTACDLHYILEILPEYTFSVKLLHIYLCYLGCTGWKGKLIRIDVIYKWNLLSMYEFKRRAEDILKRYWHWEGTPTHRKQIEYLAGLELAKGITKSRDNQIKKQIQENHLKVFVYVSED